jgi:hypothetical protein
LVPFAVVAAASAVVVLGTSRAIAPAAILALPTVLGGAAGGVVSIVRDAPDPTSSTQAFLPPEMAGMSSAMRVGIPIVVSALASATVLIVRRANQLGTSLDGAALRGAIGATLLTLLVGYWVRRRDYWRRKFRQFVSEGKDYNKPQRSTTA